MNKKSTIYLYILIAVFTIFIGASTYAFFAGSGNINATANLSARAGGAYTFTSTSATDFNLDINSADMSQSKSGNYISSSLGSIDVDLTSPDGMITACTFDLLLTWTSAQKYTESDVSLPYTHTDGITYNYEFSTIITDKDTDNIEFPERDISKVNRNTGFGGSSSGTIAEDLFIEADGTSVSKTYSIEARIYNLPVNQPNLINKNMNARITITNLDCQYEESVDISMLNYLSTNPGNTIFNLVNKQGVDVTNVDSVYFVDTRKTKSGSAENVALFKGTDNNVIKAWTNGNNLYIGSKGTTYPGPSLAYAFYNTRNLNVVDMNNVNTSEVTTMYVMFSSTGYNSPNFTLNLGNQFNTSKVKTMYGMFAETGYTSPNFTLNLGDEFDTSNVTIMAHMFSSTGYNSKNFSLNLGSEFNTSNVTSMYYMFYNTGYNSTDFTLNLGNQFNTSNVKNMSAMFSNTGYSSSWTLNLKSFDFSKVGSNYANFFTTRSISNMLTVLCSSANGDFINARVSGLSGYNVVCS